MTLTPDEKKQFADQAVTIHPKEMSDKEAYTLAYMSKCIVFRESVSSPGDLTVFVPEIKKYRLSEMKTNFPDQSEPMKNIVESVSLYLGLPVHSKEEIIQSITQKVHCHGDDINQAQGTFLAIKENALVFHQPEPLEISQGSTAVFSPSFPIRIYRPEGDPAFLETMIQQHPEKFINLDTTVESVSKLLGGYLPHELLTKAVGGIPPIVVRNPALPPRVAPVPAVVMTTFKAEVNAIRTDVQSQSSIDALRQRDIVLKKASVTVDEAQQMAIFAKCCVLRESDTDPTGITVYPPTGGKSRLKDIMTMRPECLKDDEALSRVLKEIYHFPLITEDKMAEFNQAKLNLPRR